MIEADGVSTAGLQFEMRNVKVEAGRIWAEHGKKCVITAGTEYSPKHSDGSLHPFGYALDLRSNYFTEAVKELIAWKLRAALGKGYDVILEATHIHVEYDNILRG